MTWMIEARRLPLPEIPIIGELAGHLYIEVWDDIGERYTQINGLAVDPYTNEIASIGPDGFDLKIYDTGIDGPDTGVGGPLKREDNTREGVVLFEGTEQQVKNILDSVNELREHINSEDHKYMTIPHQVYTDENGIKRDYYNSNSVFNTVTKVMQQVGGVDQENIDAAKNMGLTNPGKDLDMLDGDDWVPTALLPEGGGGEGGGNEGGGNEGGEGGSGEGGGNEGGSGSESEVQEIIASAETPVLVDPLLVDLNANGIELIGVANSNAFFDFDEDGLAEKTGWVAGSDGLLATDDNGNGIIDNVSELLGDAERDGFSELATFDSNGDGLVDSLDTNFNDLMIWQDLNENGITDAGELGYLADYGVTSLTTGYTETSRFEEGNQIIGEGHFTRNGTQSLVSEVLFQLEPESSVPVDSSSLIVDPAAYALPISKGYGDLQYLQVAMTGNSNLFDMMEDFSNLLPEQFSTASDDVRAILFEWAEATNVDPMSRGDNVDGREIAFLEKFMGRPLAGGGLVNNFRADLFNKAFGSVAKTSSGHKLPFFSQGL